MQNLRFSGIGENLRSDQCFFFKSFFSVLIDMIDDFLLQNVLTRVHSYRWLDHKLESLKLCSCLQFSLLECLY